MYRDQLPWPGRKKIYREWFERPGISAVVALPFKKHILLVQQYRYGINERLWEVPAGMSQEGETALACARRETEEETGFRPGVLRSLGSFILSPAFSNEKVHLYLALSLEKTRRNPDYDERLRVKVFPEGQVRSMLRRGRIRDAKSIIALSRYFERR